MFRDLNNHYFELFSDLDSCREVLPEKQYKEMADALMASYKRELEVIVGQKELETARDVFELRYRLKNYVPRRNFLFWNKVAKAIRKECLREFEKYLADLRSPNGDSDESDETEIPEESDLPVPVESQLPNIK